MSTSQSNFLSVKALSGLNKIGDVIIPGDGDFPKFSDTGCSDHVDEIMASTHQDDITSLNIAFSLFYYLPNFFIVLLAKLSIIEPYFPGPLGTPLRLISMALRGVPFTLYYSNLTSPYYQGKSVFDVMGYNVNVEVDDEFDNQKRQH